MLSLYEREPIKMSGANYEEECPKCGKQMECYSDYKRPMDNIEDCYHCGYYSFVQVVEETRDKGELIDIRIENEIEHDEWEEYVKKQDELGIKPRDFEEWTTQKVCAEAI